MLYDKISYYYAFDAFSDYCVQRYTLMKSRESVQCPRVVTMGANQRHAVRRPEALSLPLPPSSRRYKGSAGRAEAAQWTFIATLRHASSGKVRLG